MESDANFVDANAIAGDAVSRRVHRLVAPCNAPRTTGARVHIFVQPVQADADEKRYRLQGDAATPLRSSDRRPLRLHVSFLLLRPMTTLSAIGPRIRVRAETTPVSISLRPASASNPASQPAATSVEQARWFVERIQAHEFPLKGYLRRMFPELRDIDDLVQESFLRLWRRHRGQPLAFPKAYLFKVARRLALDALRHDRSSPLQPASDLARLSAIDDTAAVAESVCSRQEIELLHQAIASLPARCRQIFILRKIQGVPQKEIARQLQLSEQTVQGQASRGLRRCERILHAGYFAEVVGAT